jgi:hypothetical protein
MTIIGIPFWMPAALLCLAAGIAFLVPRRRRDGCVTCGYNLIGNVSGRCPECGTPIALAAAVAG